MRLYRRLRYFRQCSEQSQYSQGYLDAWGSQSSIWVQRYKSRSKRGSPWLGVIHHQDGSRDPCWAIPIKIATSAWDDVRVVDQLHPRWYHHSITLARTVEGIGRHLETRGCVLGCLLRASTSPRLERHIPLGGIRRQVHGHLQEVARVVLLLNHIWSIIVSEVIHRLWCLNLIERV